MSRSLRKKVKEYIHKLRNSSAISPTRVHPVQTPPAEKQGRSLDPLGAVTAFCLENHGEE